jgi:hypothetical protein
MIQRKGGRQIGNLIPDHKSLKSRGSNEVQLKRAIHYWKDIFKGYKILSFHFQNKLDLRNI